MSLKEAFIQLNIDNIRNIFIFATILLIVAIIQAIKPTLSLTYHSNNKPSYVKAKLVSRLMTSVTLYIWGLYYYYFTNLSERPWYTFWGVWIIIFLYYAYRWGFTKLFDIRDKKRL